MPKEFLIGRSHATLPIPDQHSSVSREHVRITQYEDGMLVLEALKAHNPVWIKNQNGEYQQVAKTKVDESTTIVLGSFDFTGFKFKPKNVPEIGGGKPWDRDKFTKEFIQLREWLIEQKDREEKAKNRIKTLGNVRTLAQLGVSVTLVGVSLMIDDPSKSSNFLRVGMAIPPLVAFISQKFTPNRDKLIERRKKLLRCPRPACNHQLSDDEIENGRCMVCKAHI